MKAERGKKNTVAFERRTKARYEYTGYLEKES